LSREFKTKLSDMVNGVINNDPQWYVAFNEDQINSYFDEDFVRERTFEKILPVGISQPRVAIEPERIRLAFRHSVGRWSTIISLDLRVWLATREPNVVALELQSLHAGSLPVTAQSLLERVSETARHNNVEVTWYRHHGNPVALLRFQADQRTPTVQLQRLELRPGTLVISGRSLEAGPRVMLFGPGSWPHRIEALAKVMASGDRR
jgi:hypothetical protein